MYMIGEYKYHLGVWILRVSEHWDMYREKDERSMGKANFALGLSFWKLVCQGKSNLQGS